MILILTGNYTHDMKRFALYFGIAAALLASCSTKEMDFQTPAKDDVVFYASFEQPTEGGTKVYANEDLLLRWTADDRVSIFNKVTYNQEYKFTGETGDNGGTFSKVGDEFATGNAISHIVSVYPYEKSTKISENETLSLELPAEQLYAENTFGLGANTMVSVTSDNLLQYKNVGGYLVLRLYGENVSVSSITLKGNNGEKLAGKATVTMPLDGTPSVEMADDATTTITLTCETPVQLGATAEECVLFWFVIPPTVFIDGFTIKVIDSDGEVYEKSTSKSIHVNRSRLSRMESFEIVPTYVLLPDAIDLGLPSGLLWASMNIGARKPSDVGGRYAWGETEMKPYYDWDNYKWYDEASGRMTKYSHTLDGKLSLDEEDDVAKVRLGNGWRMPTRTELSELRSECSWKEEELDGVSGCRVTGPNGNSIFIPNNGQFDESGINWSSYVFLWSSETDGSEYGYCLGYSDYVSTCNHKHDGLCIRPVIGETVKDLSVNGTSNCYIVNSGGRYRFNATVQGNSTESIGVPVKAEVLWESFNSSTKPNVGDVVKDVNYKDGFVSFTATDADGNALIAVKDDSDTILWSWHIWLCQGFEVEESLQTYKNNAGVMMDRNIGALSSSPGEPTTLGLLFQWGRKDPFLGACQTSYSSYSNQKIAESTLLWPQAIASSSTTGTVSYANSHPTTYITQNNIYYDWLFDQSESRWTDDSKSKYDPCPEGYRVPKGGPNGMWEIAGYTSSWDQGTRTMTVNIVENGGVAYYPACGFLTREEGKLNYAGENGLVWSATMNGSFSYYMDYYIGSSSVGTFNAYRADARPVRCCRITSENF